MSLKENEDYTVNDIVCKNNGRVGYSIKFKKYDTVDIYEKFTWNCQMSSIGGANELSEIYEEHGQKVIDIIKKCLTKNMVMVDINKHMLSIVTKILNKAGFVPKFSTPYTSTNTSKMIIVVFHKKEFIKKKKWLI